MSVGTNRNPWVVYGLADLPPRPLTHKPGLEKSPFEIASKRLEIDENVNRARLIRQFLALNLCHEQSYSFRQTPQMSERILNMCSRRAA